MDIENIGRKIKIYYDQKDFKKINSIGTEFESNKEKAIALAFLDIKKHQKQISSLLNNQEFTLDELRKINQYIPDLFSINASCNIFILYKYIQGYSSDLELDFSVIHKYYTNLLENEFTVLYNKLPSDYKILIEYEKGNYTPLVEEIITNSNPELKYIEYCNLCKTTDIKLLSLNKILNNQFLHHNNDVLSYLENLKHEDPEIIKDFKEEIYFGLLSLLNQKHKDFYIFYSIYKEYGFDLDETISNHLKNSIKNDIVDEYNWFIDNKLEVFETLPMVIDFYAIETLKDILNKNPIKLELVVERLFLYAENIGAEEIFIETINKFPLEIIKKLPNLSIIQKISLRTSHINDSFYYKIWDWLQEKMALSLFSKGENSFANHYPMFYNDLAELERYHLFYSFKDYQKYIEDMNLSKENAKDFLKNILQIIEKRVVVIFSTLENDLKNKFNSYEKKMLSTADLAVLSAYHEKLGLTIKCLNKMIELLQKDSLVIETLFQTGNNMATIPNLKGIHLGELKIGGLENYIGHGKQIKEILEPFGILISNDIKKEIDHYISIQNGNKIKLDLVESKNFKKVLTSQNFRMKDVQSQKKRLDLTIFQIEEQSKINIEVFSKIIFNRGLTKNSKIKLEKEAKNNLPYNEANGVVFDFSELENVIFEETSKLCDLINKKKIFKIEFYKEKINEIANMIATIEEDEFEECSSNSRASSKAKLLIDKCSKIISKNLINQEFYKPLGFSLVQSFSGIISQREFS